jgi:membrane carboxypeptidase/penicillin-binding protein PbpC
MAKWEVIRKSRMSGSYEYDPIANCLPPGMPAMMSMAYGMEILQTKDKITFFSEWQDALRRVYLDGRKPSAKVLNDPTYAGYSTGHWEGDTLVIQSNNFRDDGWLDINGSPLTDQATMTERWQRLNYGTLRIDVTIDDPKAYTAPFTVRLTQKIVPDGELIEFICAENERSTAHMVGK